jgi:hypothetical protein
VDHLVAHHQKLIPNVHANQQSEYQAAQVVALVVDQYLDYGDQPLLLDF